MSNYSFHRLFYCLLFLLTAIFSNAQEVYSPSPLQSGGFFIEDSLYYKTVPKNRIDFVEFKSTQKIVRYFIDSTLFQPAITNKTDSSLTIELPARESDYILKIQTKDSSIFDLYVFTLEEQTYDLTLVSLTNNLSKTQLLESYLNSVYQPALVRFRFVSELKFKDSLINFPSFSNPSINYDYYTDQMHLVRDQFFYTYPTADKSVLYIFLIDQFVNKNLQGYMVKNKAMAFIKDTDEKSMLMNLARELGRGLGSFDNNKIPGNLMNDSTALTFKQCMELQNRPNTFSYYDADEELITNNGLCAYYFWEEDSIGNIILKNNNVLQSISRPFKKNYTTYHLNITNFLFQPAFILLNWEVTWMHILIWILLLTIYIYSIVKLKVKVISPFKKRLYRNLIRIGGATVFLASIFFANNFVHYKRFNYQIHGGEIPELANFSEQKAIKEIQHSKELKQKSSLTLGSEILVKKGESWFMQKVKPVLYFTVISDSSNNIESIKYSFSSDSLILNDTIKEKAEGHYMVITYQDNNGVKINQNVYNHLGYNLNEFLSDANPSKRILLFVNGYRPTSLGHTFEENFDDILKRGLEYQDSKNLIYSFDRYDYWQPWGEMDTRFKERINPTESYYADGHHSVATSNHRSLVAFTKLSKRYPKRCEDAEHHICYKQVNNTVGMITGRKMRTTDLLPVKSNKHGFNVRKEHGKIAGKNLLLLLNKQPKSSENDTLFIIAHSMGFAYAQGMIEELRGKINFGGYYIISPENGASGKVNLQEWNSVWHYGVDLTGDSPDEPCLQDGVAPQLEIKGLTLNQRVYFPREIYKQKGFFNSHFIGYYKWIFDLSENEKGFIPQY